MEIRDLPTLNACLNSLAATLLVIGYILIRQRKFDAHKKVMLAAFTTSTVFLISYLVHHYRAGYVRFQHPGTIRTIYQAILLTHTVLAIAVAPMAIVTVYRAWTGQLARHRRLARITLPLWLYVSVTGVIVYLMLYHL